MRTRAPTLLTAVAVVWASLACAGGAPTTATDAATPIAPGTPPVVAPGTPAGTDDAASTDGAGSSSGGAPQPAPAEPPIPCSDDCLLLLDYDYDELADGRFCEMCGPYVENACDMDWPSNDVMECDRYDYLRNCIYARLGYEFDTAPEWRRVFDQESWYTPDPRFEWTRVTPTQKRNAERLRDIVKRRRCAR